MSEYENDPGPGVCDATFREVGVEGVDPAIARRFIGPCPICRREVGVLVMRPGVVRINWHERAPAGQMSGGDGQPDNGVPDEAF